MRLALFPAGLLLAFALIGSARPVDAQQFNGTYTVSTEQGVLRFTIRDMGNGRVTGSLSGTGATYSVDGRIEDGVASGSLRGPAGLLFFEAEPWEDELLVMLFESDGYGQPNYDDFTELDFILTDDAFAGVLNGNPLGGGGIDPYVGTFSDGNVVLQLQGVGGQYRGQVQVQGVTYPVQAQAGVNGIQGVIQAPDGAYAIAAQAQGSSMLVVSGGQQYVLSRLNAQGMVPPGAVAAPGPGAPRGVEPPSRRGGGAGQPAPRPRPPAGAPGRTATGRELAPGFTEDDALVREWVQYLSGKKLTRMSSYSSGSAGGYSARTDVYLCSDRSYALRDENSVSVDVGGAFGNSGGVGRDQGTWYVISNGQVAGLVLEGADGTVTELRMDFQNQETYANGDRVYVTPAEVCR
jgi:hypothetical protein